MLTELIVVAALLFLQYKAHIFLALCVVCLAAVLMVGHSTADSMSGWGALGLGVTQALGIFRRLSVAAMVVVVAAMGFVAGRWGAWVVVATSAAAVCAAWHSCVQARRQATLRRGGAGNS